MQVNRKRVFVTGATGYIGSRVIPRLLKRGHEVRALVRAKSARRLPEGCIPVVGDALDATTFADQVRDCDTFVQLVGTPHPNPSKAAEFERVDFASVRESVRAANDASVTHFIYLSVAPAASMMRAYVDVRMRGEALAREFVAKARGRSASFLRPWYVLGPGHRWPYLVVPIYWLMEAIPQTRAKAREFGLVTIEQMVTTIVASVDNVPVGERIVSVPEIRGAREAS
jgi:nucleoside-diphosphate-sugar epimerase